MSTSRKQQVRKEKMRIRRRLRVRNKVSGTPERPRLSVHRTLKNMYVQIIDDKARTTLVSTSTRDPKVIEAIESDDTKLKRGFRVGVRIAELAKEKGIEEVTFDRQSFVYHGRIKAVADGAREGGLKF